MDGSEIRIWLTIPHSVVNGEKTFLVHWIKKYEICIFGTYLSWNVIFRPNIDSIEVAGLILSWILALSSWQERILNTFIDNYRYDCLSALYTSYSFLILHWIQYFSWYHRKSSQRFHLRIHHVLKQLFSSTFRSYVLNSREKKSKKNDIIDWESPSVVKLHIYPYC